MAFDEGFPNAARAREMAAGRASKQVESAMEGIKFAIINATRDGRTSTTIASNGYESSQTVVKMLRDKGYEASYSDDQRDGAFITVKW